MLAFLHIVFYAILFNATSSFPFPLNDRGGQTEGVWTWVQGSKNRNQRTILNGKKDYPGSRYGASSWQDSNGRIWIYGGQGAGMRKPLDELWSFDVKRREWNFHQLNKTVGSEQKPPPCFGCASCLHGNRVMLFSSLGAFVFDVEGNNWTTLHNQRGSPPPRSHSASWCDTDKGILWIFGGLTINSEQKLGDFWKFSFEEMEWTEIKPMSNKSVVPNKCSKASAWSHPSGHLYMFGGSTHTGLTSEFWRFSPEASEWIKLSGITGQDKCSGDYGKLKVSSKKNHPGCREGAATWLLKDDLWMFGGSGFDNFSHGAYAESGLLSDFWVYSASSNQWVWIGGLSKGEGFPLFSEKGKQDIHNIPGPREGAVSFSVGETLWLFGGAGHDVKQFDGILNDLWMYEQLIPGDTIHISFGFRVLIATFIVSLVLVGMICTCYSKECRVFRLKRGLHPVVKYKPVEVEMIQVPQPEEHAPLDEATDRNL